MKSALPILKVAIRSPLRQCFDYLPLDQHTPIQPGQRVRVSFGRREVIGMVMAVDDHSDFAVDKLKTVLSVVDEAPILTDSVMRLYQWASAYYHAPIGEVVLGTLPKWLREERALPAPVEPAAFDCMPSGLCLNEDQRAVLASVQSSTGFQAFLVEGVTGSGKTEVYLQCIAEVLAKGKQVIVLVPEIALTPQTVSRFETRFSVKVILLHSALSNKKRFVAWAAAASGEAKIVIGTRSAVFTPLKAPGMIVIDEEHDASYKQQSGFRYSARDVAVMRANIENIPVLLGTATPSIETHFNAQSNRYHHLKLPARAGVAKPPRIACVDLCGQQLTGGLTDVVFQQVTKHLSEGGQVLFFLNRRGFAPVLMCHQCGFMVACKRCDAKMTLHRQPRRLYCHHCGATRQPPTVCEGCQQAELSSIGLGTEQLEEVLSNRFPNEQLVRVDRDSTRRKGELQAALDKIQTREASLIIGTQMLSKGHHFPHLSLVVIVDADGGLYGADFRAMEKMAQLIVQVAGRAGRAERLGEVLIQTHHPEHPSLQTLLTEGYPALVSLLLKERALVKLPPYSHIALCRAESMKPPMALGCLQKVREKLMEAIPAGVSVLGPIPAPMEKRAGHYRAQLLLQAVRRPLLQKACGEMIAILEEEPLAKKVRWSLDIDPIELF